MEKENFFHICTFCNASLDATDKKTVYSKVPPFVYETSQLFYECPNCKRSFWHGTYKKLFPGQLEQSLKDMPLPPD